MPRPSTSTPRSRAAELVGHALRAHRLQAGLTLRELADLVGTNAPMLCRFETGEREPSLAQIVDLAEACDVTPSTILCVLDEDLRSSFPHRDEPWRRASSGR